MTILDGILLLGIAVGFVSAVRFMIRDWRAGKCCGCCKDCKACRESAEKSQAVLPPTAESVDSV